MSDIVVRPGGITVVDAKNWSGDITVQRGAPASGDRRRAKELAKLEKQWKGVRLALLHARPDLRLAILHTLERHLPRVQRHEDR